jgi:hypothetical protein
LSRISNEEAGGGDYEVGTATLTLPGVAPVVVPRLRLDARPGSPEAPVVRMFIGTELAQCRAERVMLFSIAKFRDPARSYDITLLRDAPGNPRKLGWATGFSNFRFLVPQLAGAAGTAIYNDVDQVYLADPAELFDTPMDGAGYRAIGPRETSVMLLDCERMASVWRPEDIGRLSRRQLVDRATSEPALFGPIDAAWNCRDEDEYDPADAKLYHFTTLHTQPWRPFPERFVYHEHPQAYVWWELRREADAAGFHAFAKGVAPPQQRVAGAPGDDYVGELRGLLGRASAETLGCVGACDTAGSLGVEVRTLDTEARTKGTGELHDAALWVVGREGVAPDDVPRLLHGLFEGSRSLVYVRAACRPGRAGPWWWPPLGSVGTERWWIDQLSAVAASHPRHRWELDLQEQGGRRRRLRPGGGAPLGSQQPRVWVLSDGDPHHDRLAGALADAVGWPYERRPLAESAHHRVLRSVLGPALFNALLGATPRGLEGTCVGPVGDAWPSLVISAGDVCRPRAHFLRQASGHRTRVVQLDVASASPTSDFDLVVTPPEVGALRHPRRMSVAVLDSEAATRPATGGGLRQAIGQRAFARPGNDRGTTRPQLGFEALFSRLLAEGLATAGPDSDAGGAAHRSGVSASARVDVLTGVAERVRALVTRTC